MVTTIIILGAVLFLAALTVIVLSAALMVAVEQINGQNTNELDVPPIKWDYTTESGLVDAEVENTDE